MAVTISNSPTSTIWTGINVGALKMVFAAATIAVTTDTLPVALAANGLIFIAMGSQEHRNAADR
jgi:hypothetical protein